MKTFTKYDLILALCILAGAALLLFLPGKDTSPAVLARVSAEGEEKLVIDLSEDGVYRIDGAGGAYNQLTVENGQIWCSEASCPDRLCMRQGKKRLSSDTIVCLPNQMIVTIEGGE